MSNNDDDSYTVPKKRRKGQGKENLTPSPGSGGSSGRKRQSESSQSSQLPVPRKKPRSQELQFLTQPGSSHLAATPGKISKIRLLNFMCHGNLVFTFGDRINFVSGKNGSGKSAILTALVLGLGGRTTDTNRGSSLNQLLKNGEYRGSIEITISNQGALSYNRESYGNAITVVRTITETSSTYKLLSESGKVISTKRSELQLILMSFNIQANNPISILNQDTSRNFLKTATARDLYHLFRKGTLLDEIESKLGELNTKKLPLIKSLLNRKKVAYDESMKDLLEYSKKVESYVTLLKQQEELSNLQNVLAWAYVDEVEKKLKVVEDDKAQVDEEVEKLRSYIESRQSSESDLKEELNSLEQELAATKAEVEALDQAALELSQKAAHYKTIVARKMSEIKPLQKKIEIEENRCEGVKEEIENSDTVCSEVEKKRSAFSQQRSSLIKRCKELKAVIATSQVHKKQLSDTVQVLMETVNHKEQYVSNLKRSITQKQEYLKSLQKEKNELRVFAEWMPELVAEVERACSKNMFDRKPLGPFGLYIKLKDQSWGPVVESLIGGSLRSFAVFSSNDLYLMRKIFVKLKLTDAQKPNVILTQPTKEVYDCITTEVKHRKYKNLYRSIEISNPVVANVLIDLYQLDTILLVPTSQETYPLAEDVRLVPKNCKLLVNKDGTKFYPCPNYRCYSGHIGAKSRFLQVSPEQAIRLTQLELLNLKEEFSVQNATHEENVKKLKEESKKHDDIVKELDSMERQLHNCDSKLFEIGQMDVPESVNVNMMLEDLQFRQCLLETTMAQLEAMVKSKEETAEIYRTAKSQWSEKNKEKDKCHQKFLKIENQVAELKNTLRKYSTNYDHDKDKLKGEMVRANSYEEKIKCLKKELTDASKIAVEMCSERIATELSMPEIEKRIAELTHQTKALELSVGKKPVEPNDYKARVDKYAQTVDSLKRVSEGAEALTRNYQALARRADSILNLVFSSTRYCFSRVLAQRNCVGEMVINHEKKTLELSIKPDPSVKVTPDILSLSGGERSFSMIAFIMSLWQNMSTPFYFLDEFDVFMDEVNRKLIMDLLMTHARSNPSKQFVFLTPHAALDRASTDIHFFRMNDPRAT